MQAVRPLVVVIAVLSLVTLACVSQPGRTTPGPEPIPVTAVTSLPQATSVPQPGVTGSPAPVGGNPFGVMLPPQVVNSGRGMQVAKDLGVTYFRPTQAIFTNSWNGSCAACDMALQAGLQLVLTVRNGGGGVAPSSAPDNIDAYKQTLGQILDKYKPAVLVVENEENSNLFYTSSPQQYAAELTAACEVAHARGIKCTNGGLVSGLVALLVWDQYTASGDTAKAQDFASRAFEPNQLRLLNTPQARAQIDRGKALLAAYKSTGIDYLNFHWYIADAAALNEAAAYLQAQLGLPLMSNEVGQFNDDPNQTTAVMDGLVKLQVPIAVWFAMDGPMARGLMDPDGTLRPTGQAFKAFIQQHYK